MLQTIKLLAQLCFFRVSPEVLRYSKGLLVLLVVANVSLVAIHLSRQPQITVPLAWLAAIGSALLSFAFVFAILFHKNIQVRLVKVMTALFGIELVFYLFLRTLQSFEMEFMTAMLAFIIVLWNLMVKAHIFRCGFGVTFGSGIFVAILFQLITGLPFLPFAVIPK